jgi:hypothetical protein
MRSHEFKIKTVVLFQNWQCNKWLFSGFQNCVVKQRSKYLFFDSETGVVTNRRQFCFSFFPGFENCLLTTGLCNFDSKRTLFSLDLLKLCCNL